MALQVMMLDIWGVLSAIAIAALIYALGGPLYPEYLTLMLSFLVCGTVVTMFGKEKKERIGMYEYGRSWQNVAANGVIPVLALILGMPYAFVGAIAATTSDKFSSEIGSLGGEPVFLGNFKKVKRGTSGAVTALGTLAGLLGAATIAASAYLLFPAAGTHASGIEFGLGRALLFSFIGLAGSLADSVAGIWETNGLGDKATSNVAGALAGAVLGQLLFGFVSS